MSSNVMLGSNNLIISAVLTAGSAETALPITNLQNDICDASTGWQTTAGVLTAVAGATFTVTPAHPTSWRAFALVRTNLTPAAAVTLSLLSGTGGDTTLVWSATVGGPISAYRQVVVIAPTDLVADRLTVSIDDPTNPDGFINIPGAYAGSGWQPLVGMSWQSALGRDSLIDEAKSRGGQEYPIARWQQRRWEIAMDAIGGSELWSDAQELDRISRYGGNILFVPDVTSPTINNEAVFGRLESVSDVTFITGIVSLYGWRFRIRERL